MAEVSFPIKKTVTYAILLYMGTIKGLFIKIQIDHLKHLKGEGVLKQLTDFYGKPLEFTSFKDYPTADEEKILQGCVHILEPDTATSDLAYKSGHYHLNVFLNSPYGMTLLKAAPRDIKKALSYASVALRPVLSDVEIRYADTGERSATVTLKNSGYSLDHFRGMWDEIFSYFTENVTITVTATQLSPTDQEYRFNW